MKVPWKSTPTQLGDSDTVVVQVSRLELEHLRDVPGFLLTALRMRRWVLQTEGAIGVSLIAHPLKRTFWTLSAWQDEDAIARFVACAPHRATMTRYRARMAESHFHTWHQTTPERLPPDWDDAQSQLLISREGQ